MDRRRLLVTGYGGFVAGSVVWQALRSREWDVHAFTLDEQPVDRERFRCERFDLSDGARLGEAFAAAAPDAVVHTAALADIDFCQSHPEDAEKVNVGVTRRLAELCAERGAKLIFCSTDSIFDGRKGMYVEEDEPSPINHYADTKVRAERIVRETVERAAVARLSLVMGLPVLGAGNSFLARMMASLERGEAVSFPANEIRTPVDVITVGRAFLEMAANDLTGTIHLAGSTKLNRYDMACRIAERLGFDPGLVRSTDSNAIEGRAPRPNDASLSNAKAKSVLATPMQTLMDGLSLVLQCKKEQEEAGPQPVS